MIEEQLRIGELGRRTGVSPELLRAWERRYGLLKPARTPSGLRLYSPADVDRVRVMQAHLARGLAAAEAAALASGGAPGEQTPVPVLAAQPTRAGLEAALAAFDEPGAQAILDRLLANATVETALAQVILPYLRELGDRWARGEATIAQEHFASGVLRGRLVALARGWGLGIGPLALLACLPGEQHELGLICFGLLLRSRGWRVVYLGADAPLDTVQDAAGQLEPTLVVLSAVSEDRVRPLADDLRELAGRHRVAIGGVAGPDGSGVLALGDDLVVEAERVTALAAEGAR
jgi:MerR family transcriptional regulator, light-induced transcriptional regulator